MIARQVHKQARKIMKHMFPPYVPTLSLNKSGETLEPQKECICFPSLQILNSIAAQSQIYRIYLNYFLHFNLRRLSTANDLSVTTNTLPTLPSLHFVQRHHQFCSHCKIGFTQTVDNRYVFTGRTNGTCPPPLPQRGEKVVEHLTFRVFYFFSAVYFNIVVTLV